MKDLTARKQLDAAVNNVETALKDLSNRLEEALPGRRRRRDRIARAEDAVRRTAHSVAERFPRDRASSLFQEAERTVRVHPVRVALTAAVAGYCAWSLIRFTNSRSTIRKERFGDGGRLRPPEAVREHLDVRH